MTDRIPMSFFFAVIDFISFGAPRKVIGIRFEGIRHFVGLCYQNKEATIELWLMDACG
ncbi:hypothetical protein J2TS4_23170 [Paenibacillus sp. J2TS4]|nr:hypothetical protein J2TS4_23170 [Paenibacillus sp. J2TS4]